MPLRRNQHRQRKKGKPHLYRLVGDTDWSSVQYSDHDVAVHESGHVFVAYKLRRSFNGATINQDYTSLGQTGIDYEKIDDIEDNSDGLDREVRRAINTRQRVSIAILVAGDVANRMERGMHLPLTSERIPDSLYDRLMEGERNIRLAGVPYGSDAQEALDLAFACRDEAKNELVIAEGRAYRILKKKWKDVLELADELVKKRAMTFNEMKPFLSRSRNI